MSKGKRTANSRIWQKTEMIISKIEADTATMNSEKSESGAYKCCGYHDCICVVFPNAGGQGVPVPIRQSPINIEF